MLRRARVDCAALTRDHSLGVGLGRSVLSLVVFFAGCGGGVALGSAAGVESVVIPDFAGAEQTETVEVETASTPTSMSMSTDPALRREAAALFEAADEGFSQFAALTFQVGHPATLEDYMASLRRQSSAATERAKGLIDGYEAVLDLRNAHWSVAALTQEGRVYDLLVEQTRNTPIPSVLPASVQQLLGHPHLPANQQLHRQLQQQIRDTVRQVLETESEPMKCAALVRYVRAVRVARLASPGGPMLNPPHTSHALARLRLVSLPTLQECVSEAQASEPLLTAVGQGEFHQ